MRDLTQFADAGATPERGEDHEIEAPRRAGDPPIMIGDSRRARAELNWEPRYPQIESIISSAWGWHQRHPRGYIG
jgi:UDP-glucose 4-epimerase